MDLVTLFSPGHHPEGLQVTVTPIWGVLQYLSDMARSLPSIRTNHCQKLICPKLSGLSFSLVFLPLFFPFLPPFYQPLIDALLCSRYTLMRSRNSNIFKKGFFACFKASVQIKRQTRQQNGQWWWPVELKKIIIQNSSVSCPPCDYVTKNLKLCFLHF